MVPVVTSSSRQLGSGPYVQYVVGRGNLLGILNIDVENLTDNKQSLKYRFIRRLKRLFRKCFRLKNKLLLGIPEYRTFNRVNEYHL